METEREGKSRRGERGDLREDECRVIKQPICRFGLSLHFTYLGIVH